jgi:Tfp pilus assembly protein PilX
MNNIPTHQIIHERRGIALMLVMVAILVTGTMAVAYFGSRDNSIAISANVEAAARARAVAESGLDLAVAILETNSDWRTQHTDGVILDSFTFGGGEITLTIIDAETGEPPSEETNEVEITILSNVSGISQTTKATATIIPQEDEFDVDYSEYAIFAQSHITVRDVASLQQWNASPLSSQHSALLIGTLATSPMSVQVNSWGQHEAIELHARSNASSMLSTSMSSAHALPESLPFPSPPSPPSGNKLFEFEEEEDTHSWNPRGNNSNWAQSFANGFRNSFHAQENGIDVQSGSYEIESLSLGANESLTIHGDVTLTVTDTLRLSAATIILAEDATLTIHIGGDVRIDSSYIGNENKSLNSWSDPSRVQLFGQEDSDWNISGTTTIKGEVYAPQSDIELRGVATLCGRIAGDKVTLRGASRLLYDETLDHGGFADSSSALYGNDGELLSEVMQIAQLDPVLIDSLYQAIASSESSAYQTFQDWWDEPTNRPHEVVYALVVYGVDAHQWENHARFARQRSNRSYASVYVE